jgi:hypothetical protein
MASMSLHAESRDESPRYILERPAGDLRWELLLFAGSSSLMLRIGGLTMTDLTRLRTVLAEAEAAVASGAMGVRELTFRSVPPRDSAPRRSPID